MMNFLKFWIPPQLFLVALTLSSNLALPPSHAFPACEGWKSGPGQTRSITARQTVPIAVDGSDNRLQSGVSEGRPRPEQQHFLDMVAW